MVVPLPDPLSEPRRLRYLTTFSLSPKVRLSYYKECMQCRIIKELNVQCFKFSRSIFYSFTSSLCNILMFCFDNNLVSVSVYLFCKNK